jgi:outer membrane protein, multidrug efflux system
MLGPKKSLPDVQLPTSYVEKASNEADSSTEADLSIWWKQFDDPFLENLISEALSKNYDLKIARERICELRSSYRMSSSKLWPKIGFFGTASRLKASKDVLNSPVIPPGTSPVQSLFALGFDASWELDFFGKNLSARQAAYYDWLSSEEQARNVQLTVLAEVVRLYTEIRGLQQKIILTKKKIRVFSNLESLSQDLLSSGLNSSVDTNNQTAQLNAAKSLLPKLEQQFKQTVYDLAFVLGKQPEEFHDTFKTAKPIPQALWKIPVGLPSDLLQRRPDIRQAASEVYAAGARIGEAKASLFPSFSLTGVIGDAARSTGHLFKPISRFWLIWPSINWSLFEGGKVLADIQVKTSRQKQSVLNYEKTVLSALKDVENALIAYSEETNRISDLYLQWKARRSIVSLSKTLVSSGLQNLSQLLDQYNNLFNSQYDYIESKEQAMLNLIAVYKALGGGWEQHIEEKCAPKH